MPWNKITLMEEINRFVSLAAEEGVGLGLPPYLDYEPTA